MEQLFSMVLFALAAAVTPGPNTIMAMLSGLNFGIFKSLPLIFGISIGFAVMFIFVGMGLGQVLIRFPQLSLFFKVAGTIYLFYLAWLIANSNVINQKFAHAQPLSFSKGVLFQWINAKAWIVCISAVSAFTTPGDLYLMQTITLGAVFLIVGLPCVITWALGGAFLRQHLKNVQYIRGFNITMALLLASSVLPVVGGLW